MTRVSVTFEAWGGRECTVSGEVTEDPFLHRTTPEDAIDFIAEGEDGDYEARVQGGNLYGLHHSTSRHDHRKGPVKEVEMHEEQPA